MKKNLPVTDTERHFPKDAIILSTTDLKGSITYINPDFVDVSGFTEDELIGKNHNIIRHPDMPPGAFADLWSHLKDQKPWMGIVKNRVKNGDYYWVDAFVMPICEQGTVKEYQSVRMRPEPAHRERAEALYKRLMEGKPVRRSLSGRLGLAGKLVLGFALALLPAVVATQVESFSAFGWLGFLLSLLLGTGVSLVLLKPMRESVEQARRVYDNPLMTKIYTGRDDEFGQLQLALKMLCSQLDSVTGRISDTTSHLGAAAGVTSEAAGSANKGVVQQQDELNQVATAMTEMTATVQEIARNAAEAAQSTEQGQADSEEGKQVVAQTIASIHDLADEVRQVGDVIQRLSQDSASIGTILSVIRDIAEQTNLLALNAAIEAARAGEQGRGFAVVADEVRTLAGRTQESTQEIQRMIESLQSGAAEAVRVMEAGRGKAENSVQQAAKAGDALENINSAIIRIADMNLQIATASEEQSTVAAEISRNIVNISQVADETARGARESTEAVDEIVQAVERLDALVVQFRRT